MDQGQSTTIKTVEDQQMQSMVPPLKHFENLCYETMGPSIGKNSRTIFNDLNPSNFVLFLTIKRSYSIFFITLLDSMGRILKQQPPPPLPLPPQLPLIQPPSDETTISTDVANIGIPVLPPQQPPKHFFAPIRPKVTAMVDRPIREPIYATINKPHNRLHVPSTFQVC